MKNEVQLIAYADRLAGDLKHLNAFLGGPLKGVFGGLHLLPFFVPIDGADAGFDPVDHTEVDSHVGDWRDIRALAEEVDVMADLVVNHISIDSPQFKNFQGNGVNSPFADMFLTFERVFPAGAHEQDLVRIYRPRPGLPFANMTLQSNQRKLLWTTFTSQQVDIDVEHPQGRNYLSSILKLFQSSGIHMVRLDAVGYAIKRAGTSCFMIPDTYHFIDSLESEVHALGMEALVEIHSHYLQQLEIARRVDWVYDFALPPLILHSLFARDARALSDWLRVRPDNAVTVLDTHDGIGVIDVGAGPEGEPGLLTPKEIDRLVEEIHSRSGGQSRLATGAAANNLDLYQVNCTFYDAVGRRRNEYLVARAIQFFVPGIPQVYYVGLLAGTNDMELLGRTKVGRDINRHYYNSSEIQDALRNPTVKDLLDLIRLRNSHPSFAGQAQVETPSEQTLIITWRLDADWAMLEVDFSVPRALVTFSKSSSQGNEEAAIGRWDLCAESSGRE